MTLNPDSKDPSRRASLLKLNVEAKPDAPPAADPRELPWVREALASMEEGGYREALARVACLLTQGGEPLPLSKPQLAHEMLEQYRDSEELIGFLQWPSGSVRCM